MLLIKVGWFWAKVKFILHDGTSPFTPVLHIFSCTVCYDVHTVCFGSNKPAIARQSCLWSLQIVQIHSSCTEPSPQRGEPACTYTKLHSKVQGRYGRSSTTEASWTAICERQQGPVFTWLGACFSSLVSQWDQSHVLTGTCDIYVTRVTWIKRSHEPVQSQNSNVTHAVAPNDIVTRCSHSNVLDIRPSYSLVLP